MTYRKFKADYLYLGDRMAEPDSVLITTEEGRVKSVVSGGEAGEGVEVYGGLLCPGFINCHCHLELSHLRGVIPEGTGLVDFLSMVIRGRGGPAVRGRGQSGPADLQDRVREAIGAGEQEMLDNGIVAVGDICNTTDTLEQKQPGRLAYRNFIETMGFIEGSAADRFTGSRVVFDAFEVEAPGLNSIVPHAPYSVSAALFRLIADFAGGRVLSMHSQETEAENEWMLGGTGDFRRLYELLGLDVSSFHGTGKRSLESVLPYFRPEQPMILVHNVAMEEVDLEKAARWTGLCFCLCPNANRYITGKLPDVRLLVNRGCRLVVGTDSLASNHELSILAELWTLQKAYPELGTVRLLEWATSAGAAALRLDEVFGSFLPGRKPGVLLLQGLEGNRLTAGTRVSRLI
jgi:cytosine/adenosine deaminase-related metal-dependent hydrolase